MMNKDNGYGTV